VLSQQSHQARAPCLQHAHGRLGPWRSMAAAAAAASAAAGATRSATPTAAAAAVNPARLRSLASACGGAAARLAAAAAAAGATASLGRRPMRLPSAGIFSAQNLVRPTQQHACLTCQQRPA